MRIDLVFPVLPPTLDGIGDHTAHLAEAMAEQGQEVRILTAQDEWAGVLGVAIEKAFSVTEPTGILNVLSAVRNSRPDWLVFQFEQYSYGRWGFNPLVPLLLYQLKRNFPDVRLAVIFHEDYSPPRDLRSAVKTTWQLPQFHFTGLMADVAFFAVESWADRYSKWFSTTTVRHIPVGSNIPFTDADRSAARKELGLESDTKVLGLFGGAHPSRLLLFVRQAAAETHERHPNSCLLYVGRSGIKVEELFKGVLPVINMGPLPATEVSRCFSVMDLYLAPFRDGVSARRGSFLVGLQHEVATVSTFGSDTGSRLHTYNGKAFQLAPCNHVGAFVSSVTNLLSNEEFGAEVARNGRQYYKQYHAWPVIADNMLQEMHYHNHLVPART